MSRTGQVSGQVTPSGMLRRGLICHCPRCGAGHLFESWFHLREHCPRCGMRFEREEGFWLGGYVINFATGEAGLLVLLAILIGMLANNAQPNVALFVAIGMALAIGGPILMFPYSRTVWSAIDLSMRPLSDEELQEAQHVVASAALTEPMPDVSGAQSPRVPGGH
ncbi:MAG: DUF983 domain-containing protein [Acidimicrobiales bacterium]